MRPVFLLRYDTECDEADAMAGFLEKVVEVHRADRIPASFFCTGRMLEKREAEFRDFGAGVRGDPLFDLQNHSYSHIGVGYEHSQPLETLRADYERSFDAHERILGQRPFGVSLCGTGGRDGPRLRGFDQTDKARAELAMLVSLGVRMVNCFLVDRTENAQFCSYAALGHPQVMGFPSGFSDTEWMLEMTPEWIWRRREPYADAVRTVLDEIARRGAEGIPMPVMLHDWAAWKLAPAKTLDTIRRFAAAAREAGFDLLTHAACLDRPALLKGHDA